jgi:hypothetical protein
MATQTNIPPTGNLEEFAWKAARNTVDPAAPKLDLTVPTRAAYENLADTARQRGLDAEAVLSGFGLRTIGEHARKIANLPEAQMDAFLTAPQLVQGRVSSRPGHSDTGSKLGTGTISLEALLAAPQSSRTQPASMRQRQGDDAPAAQAKVIRGEQAEKRSPGGIIAAKFERLETALPLNKFTQQMQGGELQPVPKRHAPAPALKLDMPMPIWGS